MCFIKAHMTIYLGLQPPYFNPFMVQDVTVGAESTKGIGIPSVHGKPVNRALSALLVKTTCLETPVKSCLSYLR